MNNFPKVSVITPSYNQGRFIEETILSIKRQNYPNIEHIVVDGGSTDGTLAILKKYGKDIIWISEPDNGQGDAINKGLKMVTGEIIGWLNSDDLYADGAIITAISFFLKHSKVSMVYGDCELIDENGRVIHRFFIPGFGLRKLLEYGRSYIPQMSVFFRGRVLEDVGLLDINLRHALDYDFWIRIALEHHKIVHIPKVIASFRKHSTSKTTLEIKDQLRESFEVSKKYGGGKYPLLYLRYYLSKLYHFSPPIAEFFRKIRYMASLKLR